MDGFLGFLLLCSLADGILIFSTPNPDEVDIFFLTFISVSLAFLWGLYLWLRPTKEDKQRMKQIEKSTFYDECVKNGIKSCKSEKEIQKATLIAQKMGLSFTNITDLFAESKQCKKNIEQEKKDAEREKKRKEEIKEENQEYALLTRYADYSGREKRIAMLSDERKKYMEAAETLRSGASALLLASQFKEKEGDWAIMGGAASALAGPAAGMATAVSAQAKTAQENAQIRVQNQRNRELFAPVAATSFSGATQKEAAAKQLAEEIEATKMKLVADDSQKACFERLRFEETKVSVSRTGTCTVKTIISVDPFMIFDDVPAVIDGTIFAEIYDGDELLGTAQLVLPVYGVKTVAKVTGMALFCGHAGGSYRVEFSSRCLWAMEE